MTPRERKFLSRYRMIEEGRRELDRVIKRFWDKRYPAPVRNAGSGIGASKDEIRQWAADMVARKRKKKIKTPQ